MWSFPVETSQARLNRLVQAEQAAYRELTYGSGFNIGRNISLDPRLSVP